MLVGVYRGGMSLTGLIGEKRIRGEEHLHFYSLSWVRCCSVCLLQLCGVACVVACIVAHDTIMCTHIRLLAGAIDARRREVEDVDVLCCVVIRCGAMWCGVVWCWCDACGSLA